MRRRNNNKLLRNLFILILLIIASVFAYRTFFKSPDQTPQKQNISTVSTAPKAETPASTQTEETKKESTVINISAVGDCALGQDHRFLNKDSFEAKVEELNKDYSYFFSNVKDIFSKDDLTIANLETALTNETEQPEKFDIGNNYWFKGNPEFSEILKAGSVEAVSLANNHTYDYKQKGYDDTKESLEATGIEYCGYSDVSYMTVKGIKVGMVGFNQLGNFEQGTVLADFKKEVTEMIKNVKANSDLVIANFHWGKEYTYHFNETQKELGHLAIDTGADLVLGTHPHVLQEIEKYKDKYIVYSLGNFCFGGTKGARDYDTAIYQQSFTFDGDKVLQPVTAPNIIPCQISSTVGRNDYRPRVAPEDKKSQILSKIKIVDGANTKFDMVRLDSLIKDVAVDLKYATTDNITGEKVYTSDVAYLRRGTAEKLKNANDILLSQGYKIKIWDAYRASKYQYLLYGKAKNKYYFADPKIGSNHTRGSAVDLTITKADGTELELPSGFDEMSEKASRKYSLATPEQKKNALILENAMKKSGFIPLQKEWWHFDDSNYKDYDFIEYSGDEK